MKLFLVVFTGVSVIIISVTLFWFVIQGSFAFSLFIWFFKFELIESLANFFFVENYLFRIKTFALHKNKINWGDFSFYYWMRVTVPLNQRVHLEIYCNNARYKSLYQSKVEIKANKILLKHHQSLQFQKYIGKKSQVMNIFWGSFINRTNTYWTVFNFLVNWSKLDVLGENEERVSKVNELCKKEYL